MTNTPKDTIQLATRAEWRAWLSEHESRKEGIWLIRYKKASGKETFDYDEAVEEALCFGWIDSKPNKLDDERSMLWFAPRKPGTGWSALNKQRVEKLIETGQMSGAGLAKVDAAKLDGSWSALDGVDSLGIPADLAAALTNNPVAQQHFDAFPRSVKRAILEWILNAKRPETRMKRIMETVESAAKNIRANQWRQ